MGKTITRSWWMWLCIGVLSGAGCYVDSSGIDPSGVGGPRSGCPEPCQNGGVCVGTECFCGPVDYVGPTCEDRIDDCVDVECGNGDCVDLVRDYACDCNGGWTVDEEGFCGVEVVSCDTPNACINGTCSDEGGLVTCDCDPGFKGTNCGVPVSCGEPPAAPANAVETARSGTTEFGDTVTFTCEPGFEPASITIACQATGTWQIPFLNCVPEPGCGAPPPIAYGDVSTPEGTGVGAVAYYSCDPGFRLHAYLNNNTTLCLAGLVWTEPEAICLLIGTCEENPCVNGTCVDYFTSVRTVVCECDPGWSGPTCAD